MARRVKVKSTEDQQPQSEDPKETRYKLQAMRWGESAIT